MLVSILLLNRQQNKLTNSGSNSIKPIISNKAKVEDLKPIFYLLQLNLSKSSNLKIKDGDGYENNLEEVKGKVELYLQPKFALEIQPPPTPADQIIWDGKSIKSYKTKEGSYLINHDNFK